MDLIALVAVLVIAAIAAATAVKVWQDQVDLHRELLRAFLSTREAGTPFVPLERRQVRGPQPPQDPPPDWEPEEIVG